MAASGLTLRKDFIPDSVGYKQDTLEGFRVEGHRYVLPTPVSMTRRFVLYLPLA